jgi:2-oxoglutarate dehydrogenase E2 component (dihydrolipoamide succinyltransferase)
MATDLVVPALGESITEAVIARWLKKVGDSTAAEEPVVDLETDKISVQLPAPAAGVLLEQRFAEGATVKVGEIIGRIQPGEGKAAAPPTAAKTSQSPATTSGGMTGHVPETRVEAHTPMQPALSPAQRKALRENGSAPHPVATAATISPAAISVPGVVSSSPAGREEVVAMTPLRKRIAERLVEAQHTAAVLTTFNEIDMSNVMALRARYQDQFVARHGVKLGFMSFFARACVASLIDYPGLNAEIRGNDIVYKKHYDLGVAVGSGRGLVVPVLRRVDELTFAEIEKGIAALAVKVKDNKITLDDLSGGTFTITNGGIYGSMMSTPLLNMPQTGILGMHNIVNRPMAVGDKGDKIEIRPMMYVALSYDHRVVDGREAVQFLVGVKQRVESPDKLLFDL